MKKIDFEDLIKYAKEFIEINAKNILKMSDTKYDTCIEYIYKNYKPAISNIDEINNEDFRDAVVRRMCVQLQNYQRMPLALDYISYSYNPQTDKGEILNSNDSKNEIFQYVINVIDNKTEIDQDSIYYKFKENYTEKEYKDGKYNLALKKYSKGIASFVKKIRNDKNYFSNIKTTCVKLDNFAKKGNFVEIEKILEEFCKNIYYLNITLSYDYFKELACKNLVKPNEHIKEILKKYIYYGNLPDDNKITEDFITKCNTSNIIPYYADKILWLCCTGSFYEDGITIQKMTKTNFFKFIDAKN